MASWLSQKLQSLGRSSPELSKARQLYAAADIGNEDEVREWLSQGADPNLDLPERSESALDVAIITGRASVVKHMMNSGASIGPKQVSSAILRHHESILRLFQSQGVDWSEPAITWRKEAPVPPLSLGQQFHKTMSHLAQEMKIPLIQGETSDIIQTVRPSPRSASRPR